MLKLEAEEDDRRFARRQVSDTDNHKKQNKSMLTFDEFKKIDLRIGTIISAERVEKSKKLLKLHVSIGDEKRQIIAGIGKNYEPDAVVGRHIVIVANLEPKILMGLESQGMLLAADNDGPILLMPEKDVPPGSRIK